MPFASNALARLSQLSVWFIKLGIYQASEGRMLKRIETYDYPANFLARRVSRMVTIRVFHNQVFVSNTLHEDYVGLEEVADGVYDLYFSFYQIGRYNL